MQLLHFYFACLSTYNFLMSTLATPYKLNSLMITKNVLKIIKLHFCKKQHTSQLTTENAHFSIFLCGPSIDFKLHKKLQAVNPQIHRRILKISGPDQNQRNTMKYKSEVQRSDVCSLSRRRYPEGIACQSDQFAQLVVAHPKK